MIEPLLAATDFGVAVNPGDSLQIIMVQDTLKIVSISCTMIVHQRPLTA